MAYNSKDKPLTAAVLPPYGTAAIYLSRSDFMSVTLNFMNKSHAPSKRPAARTSSHDWSFFT